MIKNLGQVGWDLLISFYHSIRIILLSMYLFFQNLCFWLITVKRWLQMDSCWSKLCTGVMKSRCWEEANTFLKFNWQNSISIWAYIKRLHTIYQTYFFNIVFFKPLWLAQELLNPFLIFPEIWHNLIKVGTFWETHKIWKRYSHAFDVY